MREPRPPVRRASVHPLMHVAALAAFMLVVTTLTLVMIPLADTEPPWWAWFETHSLSLLAAQVIVCLLTGILGMVLDTPDGPAPNTTSASGLATLENCSRPETDDVTGQGGATASTALAMTAGAETDAASAPTSARRDSTQPSPE